MNENASRSFPVAAMLVAMLIALLGGCNDDNEPGELKTLDEKLQQFESSVAATPQNFNGASCLVCLDVSTVGSDEEQSWVTRWAVGNPVPPELATLTGAANKIGDRFANEISQQISACPAGSNVKLQYMYHCDRKPIWQVRNGRTVRIQPTQTDGWLQKESVIRSLQSLLQADKNRIAKIYLTSCYSYQSSRDVVNAAFQLPNVSHVVTDDDTILLNCGTIRGAKYPTFEPRPVRIVFWEKDQRGRQIAKLPADPIDADEQFDIRTNTVVPAP